jgi:hypothetical protein
MGSSAKDSPIVVTLAEEICQLVDWGRIAVFTDWTSKCLCCGIGQANYKLDRQTLGSNWGLLDLNLLLKDWNHVKRKIP